jgi:hypothetical protein
MVPTTLIKAGAQVLATNKNIDILQGEVIFQSALFDLKLILFLPVQRGEYASPPPLL